MIMFVVFDISRIVKEIWVISYKQQDLDFFVHIPVHFPHMEVGNT